MVHPLAPTLSPFEGEREQIRTLGQLLASARAQLQGAGADSAWLTSLVLLEQASGLDRTALLARPETVLSPAQVTEFQHLVRRRCAREPLAYILGYRDFCGRRFAVSPATLIPRPETEGLVGLALDRVDSLGERHPALLDVGTGSGAIAISVLAERTHAEAIVTDSSHEALVVAAENAQTHRVDHRLRLVECDLASAIRTRFSVVVANLPYVPSAAFDLLQPEVASYEPRTALDGGPDGTTVIRRFLVSLDRILTAGATALLEFGDGEAERVVRCATELLPGYRVDVQRDAAGAERFLVLERPER